MSLPYQVEAKKLIQRAYEVVLREKSRFETSPSSRSVLATYEETSNMLFEVSSENLKTTQLELFAAEIPKL